MLRGLTAKQLLGWMYYADLDPFDETRADLRTAKIEQALWNIHRDRKKHPNPFPIKDFLLRFGTETVKEVKEAPKKTWQQMKAIAQFFAGAYDKHTE